MMTKKFILNIAAILCFNCVVFGQNNNAPYSIIGIGDIEHSSFDRTSGMGHAGMALSSNRFLYNANAASLSALDNKFFNFEMSTSTKVVQYSGTPISSIASSSSDLQIKKISLAIKVKPRWGIGFGLLPYSNTSYQFYSNKYIIGTNNTTSAYYQGSGHVSQLYLSNGYQLTRGLSIGLQAAYMFGQLNQTENISPGGGIDSSLVTTRKINVGSPYLKPGFQYETKINRNWQLHFGGTATFKTSINGEYNLSVTDGNTTLPAYNNFKGQVITLPAQYSGSIAAKLKDKYTFAVDYSYQNWNDLNVHGYNYRLVNSNFLAAGFELSKKQTYRDITFERHFLQAGVFYSNSYLQVNGQQIANYGVTFGGGKNLVRSNLGVQLNMELGIHGTTNASLIEERYAQINFILSYRDFWFVKVKKFD